MAKSTDYHDYVIKSGRFVGEFEDMYRHSSGKPWHQDELAYAIFSDIDLTVLRALRKRYGFTTIGEIGCGLGYVADRMQREI
ncbi:MAG: hypothetical protein KKB20_08635, partial [Proteobacteria bacterium]|nr:hypothetical protein [Pseudomonadota bacterium]